MVYRRAFARTMALVFREDTNHGERTNHAEDTNHREVVPSFRKWCIIRLLPSLRGTKQSPCPSSLVIGRAQALEDCHENPFEHFEK